MDDQLVAQLVERTGKPEEWVRRYLGVARGDAKLVEEYARSDRLEWSDQMVLNLLRFNALKRMTEQAADAWLAENPKAEVEFARTAWREQDKDAKRPRLTDPVLGALVWNDYWWEGTATIKGLGKAGQPVPLAVVADEKAGPNDAQRAAFRAFVDDAKTLLAEAERATFDYYNRVKNDYRDDDMSPAEIKRLVPDVAKPADMRRLLKSPRVRIPAQEEGSREVILGWECRWDDEHGHQVVLRNGKAERVGPQQ